MQVFFVMALLNSASPVNAGNVTALESDGLKPASPQSETLSKLICQMYQVLRSKKARS